jgi:L,D-peptidoglycan transpeptidase YkuD (ErfK/YbiS/YcfS/YnhG family)
MTIFLKNKHTLQVDDFYFKCCIGKNGVKKRKREGDYKTPSGIFKIGKLFFRKDRIKKPKQYNKLINIKKNIHHEKIFRKDYKYDLLIPIKYNFKDIVPGKGSCIFIHLTKNYQPTLGCITIKKKDFLIMLKLINKNTKIKIY